MVKKIFLEDSKKIILKSPIWILLFSVIMILFKIPFFIYWLKQANFLIFLNSIINIPFIIFTSDFLIPPLLINILFLFLLGFLFYDIYILNKATKTIIINKDSKTIYIKGLINTNKYGLNEKFYIEIKDKYPYPHFSLLLVLRERSKNFIISDLELFNEKELFSFPKKSEKYQPLINLFSSFGVKIVRKAKDNTKNNV